MAKNDSIEMLNDKISVLKKAKKYVRRGEGLCFSILEGYKYPEQCRVYNSLKNCIDKNLGRHTWLDGWIRARRPSLSTERADMKRYRLQWIDWMLSCLEEDLQAKTTSTRKAGL